MNKTKLVDLVTKYELYYHISLGNYVYETILDLKETVAKLQELNLFVTAQNALEKIKRIIKLHSHEKDFDKNFEEYIKKEALIHALNDFIEKDKELLNKDFYKKQKIEEISKAKYFNDKMSFNFETNYQRTFEYYNYIINDKFIEKYLKEDILSMKI